MTTGKKIRVIEVGPRDGFQNIKEIIPTEHKLEVIRRILNAGVAEMEITSFVSPKAIPQMADSQILARRILSEYTGFRPIALVPNSRGAENALECGIKDVTFVISVSKSHNMENVHCPPEESLRDMESLLRSFPELTIRLALATAFVCPFEGRIAPEQALPIVERALAAGVREITLCDTVGAASPDQIHLLLERLRAANINIGFGLHLHDTRGLGLANTLAGLEEGVEAFETSVAGLGGCPFAPGAAGNTATEDLLNMLSAMGFGTGISFDRYMSAVQFVADNIQENITSRMYRVQGAVKQ